MAAKIEAECLTTAQTMSKTKGRRGSKSLSVSVDSDLCYGLDYMFFKECSLFGALSLADSGLMVIDVAKPWLIAIDPSKRLGFVSSA